MYTPAEFVGTNLYFQILACPAKFLQCSKNTQTRIIRNSHCCVETDSGVGNSYSKEGRDELVELIKTI